MTSPKPVPAPPPTPPGPRGPTDPAEPGDREPEADRGIVDRLIEVDDVDLPEELDPAEFDPRLVPDDEDDPALDAAVSLEGPSDLDVLVALDVAEPEVDIDVPLDEAPIDDDLTDLDAPDDSEMPILPWSTTVRLDGRSLPAVVEPGRARTLWLTPTCTAPTASVALELAGRALRIVVECSAEGAAPERVILGRDVLAGRFLLRP